MQALDGRAEILARPGRQFSDQGDFSKQLQRVADVLDGAFGVGRARRTAAAVERTASLRATAPIDDVTTLRCHDHDRMATWL